MMTDDETVKSVLAAWAGEEKEVVFDKMRKILLNEKIVRGKQSTDRLQSPPNRPSKKKESPRFKVQ